MAIRYYSSVAAETTLTNSINNSATTIEVASATGLPALTPFTLALDYEAPAEELVDVTAVAGTSLTVTRGVDGTSAAAHGAGARVRHTSSARDFRESREHEEDTAGVHGLDPGDVVVGTTTTQTLSNKTLNDATGTLNRIDILSEGGTGWQTTVNGDIDHDTNLLVINKGPSEPHHVAKFGNNGELEIRNEDAAADAIGNVFRIKVTKDNGTDLIFQVLSGGSVISRMNSGSNGFRAIPNATPSSVDTYLSMDPANVTKRWHVAESGKMFARRAADIRSEVDPTIAVLRIFADQPGPHTGNLTEWWDSSNSLVSSVDGDGAAHFDEATATSGILTAASGFTIDSQKAKKRNGVVTIAANITRSGATIPFGPAGSNLADVSFFTVTSDWRPDGQFSGELMPYMTTNGLGHGAYRLSASTGLATLSTWSYTGGIENGSNLRVAMTYLI